MEHTPALKALGIQPVGLSVDTPENARLTKEALNVPFPLLSDSELMAHKAFRVLNQLDDETVARYDAWDLDVERWSERGSIPWSTYRGSSSWMKTERCDSRTWTSIT